jgi:hypothetical protein
MVSFQRRPWKVRRRAEDGGRDVRKYGNSVASKSSKDNTPKRLCRYFTDFDATLMETPRLSEIRLRAKFVLWHLRGWQNW